MTIVRAILIIVGRAAVFSMLGAGLGATQGVVAPDYYRGVFLTGNRPDFNPVQLGFGLGMTQGFTGGIVIGILVVAILAWHSSRKPANSPQGRRLAADNPPP